MPEPSDDCDFCGHFLLRSDTHAPETLRARGLFISLIERTVPISSAARLYVHDRGSLTNRRRLIE
jgi:hypothetical protein